MNAALKGWLATTGAMLRVDPVELRRTLIDAGLWKRDGFGHAYERSATLTDASLVAQVALLVEVNAEQIVDAARSRHSAARAQRKAASAGTQSLKGTPPSPAPLRP